MCEICIKSASNFREICLLHGVKHGLAIGRFRWDALGFRYDSDTISAENLYEIAVKFAEICVLHGVKHGLCMARFR